MPEEFLIRLLQPFLLLLAGGLLIEAKPQVPFGIQCFDQTEHRGISNALPIAELWNVSPFDCLAHCILNSGKSGEGCAAVVYHKHFSTCQLYNHDGNFGSAKIVFASGHDYFNRTSYGGECADRFSPTNGYPQGQNRPKTFSSAVFAGDGSVGELEAVSDKQAPDQVKVEPKHKVHDYLLANQPVSKGCPRGQKVSYFVARSFVPPFVEPKATIKGVDIEGCLMYCTHNFNAVGDLTPCTLATYDTEQEHCELFDERVKELGIFTRLQNTTATKLTAEKTCIAESHECSPTSAYMVRFGRKFSNRILGQVNRIDSAVECLDVCLKDPQCRSVTFRTGRCLMHSTAPSLDLKTDNTLEADSSTMVIGSRCAKI